jgi:predicted DNA-binding transcriptional regulator YafY
MLIIEKIEKSYFPSLQDIIDYLQNEDYKISVRTIQRDIEEIRNTFDVEIEYDRTKNGYFIDRDKSLDVATFFSFLQMVNNAALLVESLTESKNASKYISFDNSQAMKGIEHLKPLLAAIKSHKEISFQHCKFHSEEKKHYTLKPYLLKEFQNRWYVVGKKPNIEGFRIFGIDRIENLEVKTNTFTPKRNEDAAALFDQVIGLYDIEGRPQIVELSFTPRQGKYIKTLPLHHSQDILIDNEQEFRISLFLIPNFELCQEILKHGDAVKVISPPFLIKKIKNVLQNALEQY